MPNPPNPAWMGAFQQVNAQGQVFADSPISPSGQYYAFLSKVDLDVENGLYDVLFEVVRNDWMDNVVFSRPVSIGAPPPNAPALLYHVREVAKDTILGVLGLTTTDELAEGSWYLLGLAPGSGTVTGEFYDPDLDLVPS